MEDSGRTKSLFLVAVTTMTRMAALWFLFQWLFPFVCYGFAERHPTSRPLMHHQLAVIPAARIVSTQISLYPSDLEDWDRTHVEDWLVSIGFGRYAPKFAADYSGIGVDGDRLVYLGTEDQLDHIEYQLELIGVEDQSDQIELGKCIIELVAATPNVTPDLLESLADAVPMENRDRPYQDQRMEMNTDKDDPKVNSKGDEQSLDPDCDYEI